MKTLLTFICCLLAASFAQAANPTFSSFNLLDFTVSASANTVDTGTNIPKLNATLQTWGPGSNIYVGSIFSSNLVAITHTNDNAAVGYLGEFFQSLVASGSAVSLTTTTPANVTSISLSAGDWDVEGNVNVILAAATVTLTKGGISTSSATSPADGSEVYSGVLGTLVSENNGVTLPRKRISLGATTTVYLVAQCNFSAGTVTAFGQINARRVR
jgi:hypothetical protein